MISTQCFTSLLILQFLTVVCLCETSLRDRLLNVKNEPQPFFRERGSLAEEFDGLPTENDAFVMSKVMKSSAAAMAQSGDIATYGGAWKVIGAGLVKLVEFLDTVVKGTCISISVEAGQTCGGLKPDTCGRLDALRDSVAKLKAGALVAIERNDDLLRWNATNVHVGFEMRAVAQIMDDIITMNAQMMDLTDTMNYDREAIPVPAEEILGESGETLADYKFRIRMQPSEFVRKVTKFLNVADIDENVKDKIAFGVALGISLSSQCVPDLFRGMIGLDDQVAAVKDRLLVLLGSADTNVTFGYQYATRRQFFANMTRGAASAVLADAQSTGLSGFFDLFVDDAVGDKVANIHLRDGNRVRVEEGASPEFLRRLKETGTLEKLVEVTKAISDDDFDKFITTASTKDPFDVLKDLEVHEIPSNPHGIDEKVIKKLSKAFKNFEKFFTDVKKSLDIASQRFEENGMSWNKIGYYGFSALEQLARFSNMALCVLNIVTTVTGAMEMRAKIKQAEVQTNEALAEIEDARVKGEKLMELQKSLHEGVNNDIRSMVAFFSNPVRETENVPADFVKRVRGVQKHLETYAPSKLLRHTSLDRARDLKLFLTSVRGVMQGFLRRLMRRSRAIQLAKVDVEVEDIRANLEALGHKKPDVFQVLSYLAFSDEFSSKSTYDSFPLDCIRKGSIKSETDLRNWFGSHVAPIVPQATKQQIKTIVEFWSSPTDMIVQTLEKSQQPCHSQSTFAHDDALPPVICTHNDVLAVIAMDVLPNDTSYNGEDLVSHRPNYDCSS